MKSAESELEIVMSIISSLECKDGLRSSYERKYMHSWLDDQAKKTSYHEELKRCHGLLLTSNKAQHTSDSSTLSELVGIGGWTGHSPEDRMNYEDGIDELKNEQTSPDRIPGVTL